MQLRLALLCLLWLAPPVLAGEACSARGTVDRIAGADGYGGLVLAMAGPVRLAGLRWPEGGAARIAALRWLDELAGRPVEVALEGPADRWERRPARLIPIGQPVDLALEALGSGIALADPAGLAAIPDQRCRADRAATLLAAEGAALKRGLGLWAEEGYKPMSVADVAALKARTGTFALVEGRVQSVGERRTETYVNFSRDWQTDFTLIVPRRIWTRLAARGLNAASLARHQVRMRGVLLERGGPAIVLADDTLLQRLESDAPALR
ncbi:MAG TPA: DNA-binding protein [Microvirga sp.]